MSTPSTNTPEYAEYLIRHQESLRGRIVQLPYQTHLKALRLGKALDVGCGAGRNLKSLGPDSIGVDHNAVMIESCRKRGMNAYTTEEWNAIQDAHSGSFDSILFSHVAEHMTQAEFQSLLASMLPLLRAQGRVVIICPQEKGYSTDATHVEFMDFKKIDLVFSALQLVTEKQYSFPFPRMAGIWFTHNEFVSIARVASRKVQS